MLYEVITLYMILYHKLPDSVISTTSPLPSLPRIVDDVESRITSYNVCYTKLLRTTLFYLEKELPASVRKAVDTYCEANRAELRLETELCADYIKIDEGEYKVMLKVLENQVPVFELNLVTYSQASAEAFINKWKHVAPNIYKCTYDKLSE